MVKANPSRAQLVRLWDSVEHIITTQGIESKLTATAEHVNIIRGQYNQLLNHLTRISEITAQMFQCGKLTARELEHIQQFHSTPIGASEELLNIITRKSSDVYESFLQSLKTTKQHDLYQMLTISVQQESQSGDECVPMHCRLIRQNYSCLTDTMDPDNGLLTVLLEKYVLSCREYEQIRSYKDRFRKNETLLSFINRKSSDDFKQFLDALDKTNQSEISKKLNEAVIDIESEQRLTTWTRKTEICKRNSEKTNPPNIRPKPKIQLPSKSEQRNPLQIGLPVTRPSTLSCSEFVAENRRKATRHDSNKRQFSDLETRFKNLQNELQTEASIKIALLRFTRSSDNIWKICIQKILQESQTHKVQSQNKEKVADEKCEKLRQDILQEKGKFILLQDEIEREKTGTAKQLTVLQERIYDLEKSLKYSVDVSMNLSKKLQENEIIVDRLKAQNKRTEQQSVTKESLASLQLTQLVEKLRFSDVQILQLQQLKEDLKNKLAMHINSENRYHQDSRELRVTCEALNTELASTKRRLQELKEQAIPINETDTGTLLGGTEKALEEKTLETAESKLLLRLKETEAKAALTSKCVDELRAEVADYKAKTFYVEQKLELERHAWVEEKEYLTKRIEDQRRLIADFGDKYKSDPVLLQTITTKAAKGKRKPIFGLAVLDKELFVVVEDNPEVEVYNSMKLNYSRRWYLDEMNYPMDIGSCNRNKCRRGFRGGRSRRTPPLNLQQMFSN